MSFFKSRQVSTPPTTGMSAVEWLEARKQEKVGDTSKKQTKKYDFLDDSSSEESFSASNFLKKSQKGNFASNQPIKQSSAPERPKTSRGIADLRSSSLPAKENSALNRFSQLEKDILSRRNKPTVNVFSSSDMDFDISSDSEIKREMFSLREKGNVPKIKENSVILPESIPYQKNSKLKTESILNSKKQNLAKKKVVSFASDLVKTQQLESNASLDDFLSEEYSDEHSLDDILPQPNIVMSLDQLKPTVENTTEDEPSIQLHTVDELLSSTFDNYEPDVSKHTKSDSVTSVDSDSNLFNVQSLEELVPETAVIMKSNQANPIIEEPKHLQMKIDDSHIEEHDYEYSEDFISDNDDTLKDTESIAEEVEEVKTESASTISESIAEEQQSASYSDTFHSLSSNEIRTFSKSISPSLQVESVAVQTDPVEVSNILLEEKGFPKITESEKTFYEPSQVINNEALAVLSSYSPAVLAVQEMLKQQLAFTRDAITRSERLYKAATELLVPDYQYASLEEAKKIINMQRQKLNLPPKYSTGS